MRRAMSARFVVVGVVVVGIVGAGFGLGACGSSDEKRVYSKSEFSAIAETIAGKYPEIDSAPSQARAAVPDVRRLRDAAPEELAEDAGVYLKAVDANGRSDSAALEKLADKITPAVEHMQQYLLDECGVGADDDLRPRLGADVGARLAAVLVGSAG